MEAFMKLVGDKYLLDTLTQVINNVVEAGLDCEVSTCGCILYFMYSHDTTATIM